MSRRTSCRAPFHSINAPFVGTTIFPTRSSQKNKEASGLTEFVLEYSRAAKHAAPVSLGCEIETCSAAPRFPTTRWSLIFDGKDAGPQPPGRGALGQICQIYWRPTFSFICRQGKSEAEAQDLTQDFFLTILEGKLLQSADPDRGRFRSLLLKSLKNFLIDADVKRRRYKRGGGIQFVPWDDWSFNSATNGSEAFAAETLFDIRWAATVAEGALRRLREECESKGHRQLYESLSRYLDTDRADISYRNLSLFLEVPETSVKRLMHEFRKRFRTLLREEVAKTIENQDDLEDEIRYLCVALSSVAS